MSRYTPRLTTVRFEDNVGTGMTIGPGEGDFTHGATNAENAEIAPVYDRDAFDGRVKGQDLAQEGSITVQMRNQALTSAVAARLNDFLLKRNFFSGLQSVDPTVWAFKIILTFNDGTTTTTRTLPNCVATIQFAEGRPAHTFAINYTNQGAIVDA